LNRKRGTINCAVRLNKIISRGKGLEGVPHKRETKKLKSI